MIGVTDKKNNFKNAIVFVSVAIDIYILHLKKHYDYNNVWNSNSFRLPLVRKI